MKDIKFVYFDIGGVMVEDFSNTNKWDQMISSWGIVEKDKKELLNNLFGDFENEVNLGKSVEDFLPMVEEKFKIKFSKNYSLNKDFVNRFYRNRGLEKIIKKYRDKYGMGLLTNMYPGMLNLIKENKLIPEINWDIILDSSIIKCKKPEAEIYEMAESRCGFLGGEILFVDNKEKNLVVPRNMGWQTFLFNSSDYERSNKELEEVLG